MTLIGLAVMAVPLLAALLLFYLAGLVPGLAWLIMAVPTLLG